MEIYAGFKVKFCVTAVTFAKKFAQFLFCVTNRTFEEQILPNFSGSKMSENDFQNV